jgi:hypothetical protein
MRHPDSRYFSVFIATIHGILNVTLKDMEIRCSLHLKALKHEITTWLLVRKRTIRLSGRRWSVNFSANFCG